MPSDTRVRVSKIYIQPQGIHEDEVIYRVWARKIEWSQQLMKYKGQVPEITGAFSSDTQNTKWLSIGVVYFTLHLS